MSLVIEDILRRCAGVTIKTKENSGGMFGAQKTYTHKFHKTGDIELPEDGIFIEINATATKGTIAKVVSIDVETYGERYPDIDSYAGSKEIVTYGITLIYEVEGRKQQGRIKEQYVTVLTGQPETKYVRDIVKHKKVVVKNPVNKYKQEMKKGDWVIGVKRGNGLGIGRITRWTNHNVWAVAGEDLNGKEFQFASINETFTMPDNEHVKLLTMAVLKGWRGE